MFCKKCRCILLAKNCILRQTIVIKRKKEGENLTTFNKCLNCSQGKKVKLHPNINSLDKDVREIMKEKKYRPPKYKLQKLCIKYNLKKEYND